MSMDVTFYTDDGDKGFVVEIGFFDTVAEIKEKVQFFAGYPVASQKLVFNGQELRDDADTERCGILHNSSVQILVASDPSCAKEEDDGDALDQTVKVNVVVSRSSPDRRLSLEASACDTVHRLKARIGDLEGIMMQGLALHRQGEGEEEEEGEELLDHHTLSDYMAAGEVEVTVHTAARPPLSGIATPAPADPYSRSLRLVVRPMFRPAPTKKMLTTVNPSRKVNDLGRVMREKFGVHWPSEGCFLFVRNHVAMDEGKSFRWHGVEEDETIEIFRAMDD
ncbi:hypothetical protein ZIOFF_068226 [Zingiber officinale]|uniref:Ubiquitin-like domain-containing protein n=2 Tax=Zingiber officinale TaxID=94328 RepID=A0A8J5CDG4_ZINOF|nr:hypothetical protein ZIOFF_068226 [Zingiber officinale]